MKKTTIILLSIFFLSFSDTNIYAQDYKHTLNAGGGISLVGVSLKTVLEISKIIDNLDVDTIVQDAVYSSMPAIGGSYGYMINELFSVGIASSYQTFNINNDVVGYSLDIKRTNFALRGLIHYGKSEKIDMYSGIRLGLTNWKGGVDIKGTTADPTVKQTVSDLNDYFTKIKFAPQLIVFGIRGYFINNVGAFAEIAIGPSAFLFGGLTFRI